ncbi:hypothetical protein [uncultured Tateyamaria sp.]|uniref:hypothetical protein n=1 Tax=uncultured Tateyamaria sp. TaxID=455651 RepID=UPI0026359B63|nr:hypothetical protein [uncultured Tateyamaria sp.]
MSLTQNVTAKPVAVRTDASALSEEARDDGALAPKREKRRGAATKKPVAGQQSNQQMRGVFDAGHSGAYEEATDNDGGVERGNAGRARKGDTLDDMELDASWVSNSVRQMENSTSGNNDEQQPEKATRAGQVTETAPTRSKTTVPKTAVAKNDALLRNTLTLSKESTSSLALSEKFETVSAMLHSSTLWTSDPLFDKYAMRVQFSHASGWETS